MFFCNKHEAIAAWNRRVAPKWTKEPEETGYHWATFSNCRGWAMTCVYEEDGTLFVRRNANPKSMPLEDYIDKFHVAGFCKIDLPALPEEGGKQ